MLARVPLIDIRVSIDWSVCATAMYLLANYILYDNISYNIAYSAIIHQCVAETVIGQPCDG